MERLTDRRTAQQVRENIEKLRAAGVKPSVSDVRYVRLAEYENKERRNKRMAELKPCPFCGSEPTIRVYRGKDGWRDRYAVLCRYDEGGCGAESGLYHYENEAVEAWNRRAENE